VFSKRRIKSGVGALRSRLKAGRWCRVGLNRMLRVALTTMSFSLAKDSSMTSAPLHRLVYTSVYRAGRVDSELVALRAILSVSRKNNQAADVTGYLIFDGDSFVQVLEGPRQALETTMSRIQRDDRHRDVTVLAIRPAEKRSFDSWTMGGYRRTPQQDPIFAAHGVHGKIDLSRIGFETAVSLAEALSAEQAKQAR
jgi:hypothetical protein